jgi:hypothetical protein
VESPKVADMFGYDVAWLVVGSPRDLDPVCTSFKSVNSLRSTTFYIFTAIEMTTAILLGSDTSPLLQFSPGFNKLLLVQRVYPQVSRILIIVLAASPMADLGVTFEF